LHPPARRQTLASPPSGIHPALPYRRLQFLQSNQRSIWISVLSAHPRGIRKVRNCRSELPSQINDLEFRTEFTKSGALERMGRRETKTAVYAVSAVRSFPRKACKHWAFQGPRLGPETVVPGGNGGGKGTGIQRSLRSGAQRCGGLRGHIPSIGPLPVPLCRPCTMPALSAASVYDQDNVKTSGLARNARALVNHAEICVEAKQFLCGQVQDGSPSSAVARHFSPVT